MGLARVKRRAQGWRSKGETFDRQDLTSLSAPLSDFEDFCFVESPMGLADFTRANLHGHASVFESCKLYGASFAGAVLENVSFYRCDLTQARFDSAILKEVRFVDCQMTYSSFAGATVRQAHFTGCNLHGADLDFIEADSGRLSFDDCNLWGAKSSFGCAFWNGHFDEKNLRRFVALIARKFPPGYDRDELTRIAGHHLKVVTRLMEDRDVPQAGDQAQAEEAALKV